MMMRESALPGDLIEGCDTMNLKACSRESRRSMRLQVVQLLEAFRMKLTPEELKTLRPGQKLWLHDVRFGKVQPRPAVLRMWNSPKRFFLHIFEDGKVVEHFPRSLDTNQPIGHSRMAINQKLWLSKRD